MTEVCHTGGLACALYVRPGLRANVKVYIGPRHCKTVGPPLGQIQYLG